MPQFIHKVTCFEKVREEHYVIERENAWNIYRKSPCLFVWNSLPMKTEVTRERWDDEKEHRESCWVMLLEEREWEKKTYTHGLRPWESCLPSMQLEETGPCWRSKARHHVRDAATPWKWVCFQTEETCLMRSLRRLRETRWMPEPYVCRDDICRMFTGVVHAPALPSWRQTPKCLPCRHSYSASPLMACLSFVACCLAHTWYCSY